MKLLRLALACAALGAALAACEATRATAPDRRPPARFDVVPDTTTVSKDGQTMGSGG